MVMPNYLHLLAQKVSILYGQASFLQHRAHIQSLPSLFADGQSWWHLIFSTAMRQFSDSVRQALLATFLASLCVRLSASLSRAVRLHCVCPCRRLATDSPLLGFLLILMALLFVVLLLKLLLCSLKLRH